jgi:D-alanyl-D-alanine carboxypeptidase
MVASYSAVVDTGGDLKGEASTAVVPWWSFTKTLIAACALRLVQDGRLTLDAPLADGPYTLRALLQHRAGVGNYSGLPEYHEAIARGDELWSDAELFARIPADRLLFAPGTGWAYSNVGYLLVRRLIERTCGAGLRDVLRTLVLAPLGLQASRLAETRADMRTTVFEGGQGYHPGWAFHGFVVGPVAEAALALHRLLSGDLLTPASLVALLDCHATGGPVVGRPWLTTGYGLGLMMGAMQRPGMAQPLEVIGQSAGGPGNVGAVYWRAGDDRGHTVAVFVAGSDEGVAEYQALEKLIPI